MIYEYQLVETTGRSSERLCFEDDGIYEFHVVMTTEWEFPPCFWDDALTSEILYRVSQCCPLEYAEQTMESRWGPISMQWLSGYWAPIPIAPLEAA